MPVSRQEKRKEERIQQRLDKLIKRFEQKKITAEEFNRLWVRINK